MGFAAVCVGVFACLTVAYPGLRIGKAQAPQKPVIYDVEYSVLEAKPQEYVGKIVRVKALVFGGPLDDPRLVEKEVPRTDFSIGYDFAPGIYAELSCTVSMSPEQAGRSTRPRYFESPSHRNHRAW